MAEITGISPHQAGGELIFHWFPELETLALNARVSFYRREQRTELNFQQRGIELGRWTYQEAPQDLNALHADFVATVSHELRIPLTSIKGFVDTLLRSRQQLSEEQQVHFLTIIKDQADRLTRMVEDLLVMSKIESGHLPNLAEGVCIREVLERTLAALAQKAASHKLVCDLAADLPKVWADRDRLEQIFVNLLDNALKYSQPGTTVTIRGWVVEGDFITLSVQDQGIGIDSTALEQIFERFCHIDQEDIAKTAPIGLGLYITKSLVESLGGRIEVVSTVGQGTTFTVWLPTTPPLAQNLD
ncbi:cell wall metabolism sensor histidine kinase WalK [Candidatus Cyanaurora vandensis]|uniref:sensor histidine kinase n=1 Tax=Candidatus Cyanaurora vandensis TaxID=2714958 RepID=UPI00257D897B|nr:ATP-binding protein [Candidatus Cyanaurora vandensis]